MTSDSDRQDPLLALASEARVWSEQDYGTERQIDAFNAFLAACKAKRPKAFSDTGPFADRIEKATSDEIVDHALATLGYEKSRWPWKLGDRVVLPDGYEAYSQFSIPDRMTGTVTDLSNRGYVFVAIDGHRPELNEWENVLHVYEHTDGTTAGMVRDTDAAARSVG